MPRNRELMRVFKDVGLVEHLGSGMSRILKAYDESIFDITPNFLVVTFPFEEGFALPNEPINEPIKSLGERLLSLISSNQGISKEELAEKTDKSRSTITREIKKLCDAGKIKRIGSNKVGHWEIAE